MVREGLVKNEGYGGAEGGFIARESSPNYAILAELNSLAKGLGRFSDGIGVGKYIG